MADIKELVRAADQFAKALRAVQKIGSSGKEALALIDKAISAEKAIDLVDVRQALQMRREESEKAFSAKLDSRRQDLESAAVQASVPFKRFGDHDRIDMFKLKYNRDKVTVYVGSEKLTEFDEIDGKEIYRRIADELSRLKKDRFSRKQFFQSIKVAIAMAKADGKVADNKVKIRDLFPYVAASLQLQSDAFKKRPSAKNFLDYSLATFAFDLSRFGEADEGWSCGEERLCNQGPNMATQSEAVSLPGKGDSQTQVLWLWTARA